MDDNALIEAWLHDELDDQACAGFAERLHCENELQQRLCRSAYEDQLLDELLAPAGKTKAVRRRTAPSRKRRSTQPWIPLAAAAAGVALAIMLLHGRPQPSETSGASPSPISPPPRIAVVTPEDQSYPAGSRRLLSDGSELACLTRSRWSESAGRVELQFGTIAISGHHSPEHSLVVVTAAGRIQAVGTEFTISHHPELSLCSVASGRVLARGTEDRQDLVLEGGMQALLWQGQARPCALLWRAEADDSQLDGIGDHAELDGLALLGSQPAQDPGSPKADQHIVRWRHDGRPLVDLESGSQLVLRIHAAQAGNMAITLSLAEPLVVNEFNYCDVAVVAGWQTLVLPIDAMQPGPGARALPGQDVLAIGIYGHGIGQLGLQHLAFIKAPELKNP